MRIVFLGTSPFAAAVLERLASERDVRPALVITRPDRPAGRGRHLLAPPVASCAGRLAIELAQPQDVNGDQAREMIRGAGEPTTVVVCAFGALIREPLLSEHDILNVHPSLLPRWRGAAPIERAIMAGDDSTGVCIMQLTAGLDSGPVLLSQSEPILPEDDHGSLSERLQRIGGELLVRALREQPARAAQDESGATYAEKITAADRLLDPARSAAELERTVRALTPHIGARVLLADGSLMGVRRVRVSPEDTAEHGLHASGERLLMGCSPGVLELTVVQPAGGREMSAAELLRGRGLPAQQRR